MSPNQKIAVQSTPATTGRRYELDWLRVLAILSVFVYHTTRFFNRGDWHVKNATTYWSVDLIELTMEVWLMPVIFVISGISLSFALRKSGFWQFYKDKALRLLVPLAVGALTHVSLQVYLERLTHGQFRGSYFDFLPHYFSGLYVEGDPSAGNFAWMGLHLWYLLTLFGFTLLLDPLFRWLSERGRGVRERIVRLLCGRWGLLVLALPLVVLEAVIPDAILELGPGGWPLVLYSLFLLGGFFLAAPETRVHAEAHRRPLLLTGLALTGVTLFLAALADPLGLRDLAEAIDFVVFSLAGWSMILAFLGYGAHYLNRSTPFLQYANVAVLPFYILHQTVMLVLGYFILQWPVADGLKWLAILVSSLAGSLGLYEFVVRRNNLLRFLFGMKPLARVPAAQPAEPVRPEAARPL